MSSLSRMLMKCSAILLLNIFCFNVTLTYSIQFGPQHEAKPIQITTKVLNTLLNDCQLELQDLVIRDMSNNSAIYNALSSIQMSAPKVLKAGKSYVNESGLRPIKMHSQGVMIITDNYNELIHIIRDIMYVWPCNVNCTVIILTANATVCSRTPGVLYNLGLEYIVRAYVVCTQNSLIITQSFGDQDLSSFWQPIHHIQKGPITWTLYSATIKEDFSSLDLCGDLIHNQRDPSEDTIVRVCVMKHNFSTNEPLYFHGTTRLKNYIHQRYFERVNFLQKLLKKEFYYYIKPNTSYRSTDTLYAFKDMPCDIILNSMLIYDMRSSTLAYSYAGDDEHIIIISHNRGLATPVEKIAKYYGLVTLVSLIVISLMTFLVVWLKTDRNIAWATFDILRLLINSDVTVPLNTLSIKIFFSMIFLYFLILHATLSGHLAEFLTIPQNRDNIDSLKDLKDPRITTIYTVGFKIGMIENFESLGEKVIVTDSHLECMDSVFHDPNSVCVVGKYSALSSIIEKNLESKFYCSKNSLSSQSLLMMSLRRFPYQNRFSWAFLAASETKVWNNDWDTEKKKIDRFLTKKKVLSQIDFRPIALTDLKFAFTFLIVGNTLGLICFLIELVIGRKLYAYITLENFRKILIHIRRNH